MKSHPGRRGKGLRDARRERDQHRDDLHLADQDLVRDRRRPGAGRRPRPAHRVRASAPTRSSPRTRRASTARRSSRSSEPAALPRRRPRRDRRRRLDDPRGAGRARVPGRRGRARSPPSARPASASPFAGGELEVSRALGRVDPGARPGALLGRRRGQLRVGAADRRRRRGGRRQHELLAHARRRAAGRLRGQPGGGPRSPRPDRQPELHDDGDGRRAGADPARGRASSGSSSPPTRPSPAPGRRRSRSCSTQSRAVLAGEDAGGAASIRTRSPSTCCPRSRPSRTATTTRPRSAR